MNSGPPTSNPSPLLRRIGGKIVRTAQRAFRPITRRIRDWQAPRLHRYMMHEASVPMEPTQKPAVVIAPHADDETFGCGGMIALKRDAGVPVHVVVMTDGRNSHSHVPGTDAAQLIETRKRELREACRILGVPVENVHFFDLPDQGLTCLSDEQRRAAVARLAALLRQSRAEELYVNHPADRHPDHEATYRIVSDATKMADLRPEIFQYPVWLLWKGPARRTLRPADLRGAGRLDVRGVQERKERAIQIYASQLPVLPAGFVEQFRQGYEVFFRTTSRRP